MVFDRESMLSRLYLEIRTSILELILKFIKTV